MFRDSLVHARNHRCVEKRKNANLVLRRPDHEQWPKPSVHHAIRIDATINPGPVPWQLFIPHPTVHLGGHRPRFSGRFSAQAAGPGSPAFRREVLYGKLRAIKSNSLLTG